MKKMKQLLVRMILISAIVSMLPCFHLVTSLQADGLSIDQAINAIISPISNDSYHYSFAGGDHFDTILTSDQPAVFYNIGLDCTSGTLAIVSKAVRDAGGDPYTYFEGCRDYLNQVYPWDLSQHFTNMTAVSDTSNLLPGDILVYGYSGQKGHMSVYAGNGKSFDFGDRGNGSTNNYSGLANYLNFQSSITHSDQSSYPLSAVYRISDEKTITYNVSHSSISPDVSSNNQMYPLSDAQFGVYTEPDCSQPSLLEVIETDASGTASGSQSVPVEVDTVYMKQLSPFTNHSFTDTTVHEVPVVANEASVTINEEPLYTDSSLTFTMADAEEKDNASSQQEAQFTIDYYDTTEDITNKSPLRTWVIQTKEERSWNNVMHLARLDKEHLVSGDLFTNSIGATVIPAGTLSIRESKASSSYSLSGSYFDTLSKNEEISSSDTIQIRFVNENGKIVKQDSNAIALTSYVKEEVPIRGSFELQKADADLFEETSSISAQGDASFAYAEFDLYYLGTDEDESPSMKLDQDGDGVGEGEEYLPSEETPIYHLRLDETGKFVSPNSTFLAYGNYKLIETKSSEGYSMIDPSTGSPIAITFSIQNEKETVSLYAKENVIRSAAELNDQAEGTTFVIVLKRHVSKQSNITKQDILASYEQCLTNPAISQMEYDQITVGADGSTISKQLAYGEYFMVSDETDEVISFSITKENETLTFSSGNQEDCVLKIIKKDADTGNPVTYTSSAFKIRMMKDADGNDVSHQTDTDSTNGVRLVDGYVTFSDGEKSVFMTSSDTPMTLEKSVFRNDSDASGTVSTPFTLKPGEYQLEECITSKGYITSGPQTFTISSGTSASFNGEHVKEVYFENRQLSGEIHFTKEILKWDGYDETLLVEDLSSFTFYLYAAEDIYSSATHEVIVHKGEKAVVLTHDQTSPYRTIEEIHPDANGNASVTDLPLGKYILKEGEAEGYVTNTQEWNIEISQSKFDQKVKDVEYEGEAPKLLPPWKDYVDRDVIETDVLVTTDGEPFVNEGTKASFSKKSITSEDELPGAHLMIKNSIGEIVTEWISTDQSYEIEGLPVGEYTLIEEAAPDGYFYHEDQTFVIKDTNTIQKIEMKDTPVKYQIEKVDEEGKHVEGVKLRLSDITDPTAVQTVALPNEGITTDQPFTLIGVLQTEHMYELVEEEYVDGVFKAASLQFEVPKYNEEEMITITMVDANTDVSVQKIDESNQPVVGAKLAVLKAVRNEDGTVVPLLDASGNPVSVYEFVTDDEAEDISPYVKGSNEFSTEVWYILREKQAPAGYEISKDISFVVTSSSEVRQTIQMVDRKVKVQISDLFVSIKKVDASDRSKVLQGAEFTMYTKDGKIAKDIHGKDCIALSDENGMITWNMEYSKDIDGYYIQETKALQGYQLNRNRYVISYSAVKKDHTILFEVENKKITTVDTSQRSDIFLFASICSIALIGAYLSFKFRVLRG